MIEVEKYIQKNDRLNRISVMIICLLIIPLSIIFLIYIHSEVNDITNNDSYEMNYYQNRELKSLKININHK